MIKQLVRWLVLAVAIGALLWVGVCALFILTRPTVTFSPAELARPAPDLPAGFLWGTATSAHQLEGGNENDWTRFESVPGNIEGGDRSTVAADHWNRMAEDVAHMTAIGANAYRFSIEWSRLEPEEGSWNEAAWARYQDLLRQLREAGITPMVTLLHFTLPNWMADRGGVAAADFPERFSRFAAQAARRLGPDVELWCTINEPNVQMYMGYMVGNWPPLEASPARAASAWVGLARAHAAAAKALRSVDPDAKIGIAQNQMALQPAWRLWIPDWLTVRLVDQAWNWAFHDAVQDGRVRLRLPGASIDERMPDLAGSADFLGLNYYHRYLLHAVPGAPQGVEMRPGPGMKSELGGDPPPGDSYPEGMLLLMREAWDRYGLPIYITEAGIADDQGVMRGPLIRAHVEAIQRALSEDIPVRGYFHWTLMDSFEWEKGYRPRFGLYHVDRETLERTRAGGAEVFLALAPPR
jgi:beta-glucosidase